MQSNAGRCARCHRLLKDPLSIRLGMGPECRQRSHSNRTTHTRPIQKNFFSHGSLAQPAPIKIIKPVLKPGTEDTMSNSIPDIVFIPIEKITINPYQPGTGLDTDKVYEIAESLGRFRGNGTKGLNQVPVARQVDGHYELAFGRHRLHAFKYLAEEMEDSFFAEMPVILQDLSDDDMYARMVSENLDRRDISIVEIGEIFHDYMTRYDKNSVECGLQFGRSEEYVRSAVRMLNLPEDARGMLREGKITVTAARTLLTVQKLAPAAVPEVLERMTDEDEDDRETPREAARRTLMDNDNIEEMWNENWRKGKPLAGDGLWPLDMKRFPNNLLPELTAHDVVFAFQLQEDEDACARISRWEASSESTQVINRLLDTLKGLSIHMGDEDIAARVKHLVSPPSACTACPFYARMEGIHYCGMKTCWKRKETAWKQHLIESASEKLGMPIYDEKTDGPMHILEYGEYGLIKSDLKHCRLMPKGNRNTHQYLSDKGVPNGALVVLVGEAAEKIKEKEHVERMEKRSQAAETRRVQALKEQVMALLWEIAPCFTGLFDKMPETAVQALHAIVVEGYFQPYDGTREQEDQRLPWLAINVVCQAIDWDDSMEPKDIVEAVQKLAKTWKVKLPKDWAGKMQNLGQINEEE